MLRAQFCRARRGTALNAAMHTHKVHNRDELDCFIHCHYQSSHARHIHSSDRACVRASRLINLLLCCSYINALLLRPSCAGHVADARDAPHSSRPHLMALATFVSLCLHASRNATSHITIRRAHRAASTGAVPCRPCRLK